MDIISLDGHIYVQMSFLKKYGVNEQTVMNGMNRNRNKQTKHFEHLADPEDKRLKWIKYSSLSVQLSEIYELPSEEELSKAFEEKKKLDIERLITTKFEFAMNEGYRNYLKHYQGYFYEHEIIHQYAKNHAIFQQIQQLRYFSVKINKIFHLYKKLNFLIFETESLKVFYAKLKDFEQYGHEALIHKSLGKTKNNRKLSDAHLSEIKKLYRDARQFSYKTIHEKLNSWAILNGYSEVSIGTIKSILADKYIQNQCKPSRNGKEWAKLHLDSYRLREEPEANGELWQIDGSRFQFPYLDENNNIAFLVLFVVMDVHSRMIIGYSIGKSENHQLVIQALRMAAENTRYIPIELLRDQGSCFKHSKYKTLEHNMIALGTNVRVHLPSQPNDKGHIESFFSVFQTTVCKGIFGYMGEGIKSKRESGRPSRAMLEYALKKKNIRTKKELEKLFVNLIEEYNNKSSNPSKNAPSIRFTIAKSDKYIYKFSENEFALMFWSRVQEYHVHKSMILLSEGSFRNKQFQYLIYDEELKMRLNRTNVIVCFQNHDRSRIKLFDENERFITDLEYSEPVKIVRRSKQNKISIKISRESSKYENDANEELNQVPRKDQLYKQPATLEVLLIKTKGHDK